jgi:hypothetical protein
MAHAALFTVMLRTVNLLIEASVKLAGRHKRRIHALLVPDPDAELPSIEYDI